MAQRVPADGPTPSNAMAPLTAAERRAVIDTVAAQLTRFYALADTGRLIAERLRQRLAAGAYDTIGSRRQFADVVTADMKSINGDRHLSLGLASNAPTVPTGLPALPPLGLRPRGDDAPVPAEILAASRRNNFGIGRVEVLPGNVGYLEFRNFDPLPQARTAVASALALVQHADALIIDVREHMGGSGVLSNFVISHFVGPDTVPVLTVAVRAAQQHETRYTLREVPGPRRPEVPLYVLTSRGTVSAGEDFAFVLKNLGRATLVGETTAGAGRNNVQVDAGHGFTASISVSTVTDPRSGREWEGVGVVPDLAVPPRTALTIAHAHAARALARTAAGTRRRDLELTAEFVEARARSRQVPASTLQRYVGTYGGERSISLEHGALVFRRYPERLGQPLVPLSDSVFALGPLVRLAFERDGATLHLRATANVGESMRWSRTGPPPRIASEYDE